MKNKINILFESEEMTPEMKRELTNRLYILFEEYKKLKNFRRHRYKIIELNKK